MISPGKDQVFLKDEYIMSQFKVNSGQHAFTQSFVWLLIFISPFIVDGALLWLDPSIVVLAKNLG
jgi:hypothetical protein